MSRLSDLPLADLRRHLKWSEKNLNPHSATAKVYRRAIAKAERREKPIGLLGLAEHTRLPAAWLKREAKAGRIPCLNAGGRFRFNLQAVERALAERAATERYSG